MRVLSDEALFPSPLALSSQFFSGGTFLPLPLLALELPLLQEHESNDLAQG